MKAHTRPAMRIGALLLTMGLAATSFSFGASKAAADEFVRQEVKQTVSEYGNLIESQYENQGAADDATGREKGLARLNGVESDRSGLSGLNVSEVNVSTAVTSYSASSDGASVFSDVTVKRRLVPEPDVSIMIAGEQRDHLDSEYTETHLLELQRAPTGGYDVADDIIVNTDGSHSEPNPSICPRGPRRHSMTAFLRIQRHMSQELRGRIS